MNTTPWRWHDGVETCRSVIIYKFTVNVLLLVILQNNTDSPSMQHLPSDVGRCRKNGAFVRTRDQFNIYIYYLEESCALGHEKYCCMWSVENQIPLLWRTVNNTAVLPRWSLYFFQSDYPAVGKTQSILKFPPSFPCPFS